MEKNGENKLVIWWMDVTNMIKQPKSTKIEMSFKHLAAIHHHQRNQRNANNPQPSDIYLTLRPLIVFVFLSTIFMGVAVGLFFLAMLIVHVMLDK